MEITGVENGDDVHLYRDHVRGRPDLPIDFIDMLREETHADSDCLFYDCYPLSSGEGSDGIACDDESLGGDVSWDNWLASDDVKGGWLPPDLVYQARLRELEYLKERCVYGHSTVAEAKRVTGKPPLRLKWIDTDKGGEGARMVRSRLVCTEVRPKGKEAI